MKTKNPQQLASRISKLVELKKIKEPKFLKALLMYPPPPIGTLNVIPNQVGMFEPKTPNKYTFKTYEIVYEEDEIRNLFYSQHPFELFRPINANEHDNFVVWDSIEGTPKQELKGENVIQRTLYLRSEMGLSDAYKQALKEFYQLREKEEEELKKESGDTYEEMPFSQAFLVKEREYLQSLAAKESEKSHFRK